MADPRIVDYIKQKISEGVSKEQIKETLLKAEWSEQEIEEGFGLPAPLPVPPPAQREVLSVSELPKIKTRSSFSWRKFILIGLLAVAVLVLIGLGLYIYMNKSKLFGISPYTEKNLLSGLLASTANIKTSSYLASISLDMGPREAGATPFVTKLSNADEIRQQYLNDSQRGKNITAILSQLKYRKGGYPNSLQELVVGKINYSYYDLSIVDPVTQQPYGYSVAENGGNFSLSITFETNGAVSQVRKAYQFSDATTIVNGKTVTFTKDSYPYLYLSATPPKPLLASLADTMTYIPPETKASASVSAQSDWSNKESVDWKFNVDATGDLGDLTYKFNIDALRKEALYYFRINNMPSFFFSYIGFEKGQWIKVDPAQASSWNNSYFSKELPDVEKYYKEHRQEVADLFKKMVTIADEEGLVSLKNSAQKEQVEGRDLYRYDLAINKDAVVPFYKRLVEESNKSSLKSYNPAYSLTDNGYLEYLQSPEFNEVFDYYQQNTKLTLWVDSQGYPAIVSYGLRIIPADSVTSLKDKQANIVFKLVLSDVNQPVDIKVPADAKDITEVMQSNPYYQKGKDATIKGNLSVLLIDSAVYYETNRSYNNWCTSEKYYAGKKSVDDTYGTGSKVNCSCNTVNCVNAKSWCASALISTGDYYCIDSTGVKRESTHSYVCSSGLCSF